jgi:hypothetical protein
MSADPATIAGIALAIPGIIDLCIEYAGFLIERYESAREHKHQIGASLVVLKNKLSDIVARLGALDELTDDEKLLFAHEFQELSECVQALRLRLESINRAPPSWKWALVDKRTVDRLLKRVQRAYDAFALKYILLAVENSRLFRQDRRDGSRINGPYFQIQAHGDHSANRWRRPRVAENLLASQPKHGAYAGIVRGVHSTKGLSRLGRRPALRR